MSEQFNIEAIRLQFPALHQEVYGHRLAYLDSAATAHKPQEVIDAMTDYYQSYPANINRGAYYLSEVATKKYQEARATVAQFIGSSDPEQIIFTRGTTESINLVANGLGEVLCKEGDEIILTELEHHANIVPWYMLAKKRKLKLQVARVLDSGELDVEHFKSLFNAKTKLAAFVHASNALGTINPVKTLVQIAQEHNVATLIDGAQAVHHLPLNMGDIGCDFYAFSGHKAYGPTGIGVLYAKNHWLKTMPPYQGGGDMIASVSFDNISYAAHPQKFEAGTPNIAGALGLAAAIHFLQDIGLARIHSHEQFLHDYALEQLAKLPQVRVMGSALDKVSVISFIIPGVHPHDISSIFDRQGVAIRAGHLCTEPLVRRFGVNAFARVSLGLYNNKEDIDQFISAFGRVFEVFRI